MSRRDEYEKKTLDILMPILESNGFELWDVEYVKEAGNWYLRAFIDKNGGITIDDCELVSRALSDELDKDDFIEDAYILEVSSPGLGRHLKRPRDFEKSIGQEVEIHTYKPIDKQKEFFGILKSYDDNDIVIVDENEEEMKLSRKEIAMIRLAFDF